MKNLIMLLVLLLGLTNIFTQDESKIICEVKEAFYITDYNIIMTHIMFENQMFQVWFEIDNPELLQATLEGPYYIFSMNPDIKLAYSEKQNIIPLKITRDEYKEYIEKLNRKRI